ncbi:MAG: hypothetical protein RBU21_07435 [FCB group bacterium]|nr:hypothetical protein [FCB group bacterium]
MARTSAWIPRLALALVALGIFLRLALYAFDRELGMDETMLALNFVDRSYGELFEKLDNRQGAPIGFLLASKAIMESFGRSENALRALPLLAALLSVLLFHKLSRRVLDPYGMLCALALFAVGEYLIDYADQLKQYSTDVLIAIGLLLLSLDAQEARPTAGRLVLFAAAGAAAVWFSHAAVIVLTGVGVTLGVQVLLARDARRTLGLVAVGAAWTLSLGLTYFISLRHLTGDAYLQEYWARAFMPLPLSVSGLRWYVEAPLDALRNPGGIVLTGVGAFAALYGGITIYRQNRPRFWLLISPIVVTLALSALHQYPFGRRLILFLVPFFLLFIGAGIGRLFQDTRESAPLIAVLVTALLLLQPVAHGLAGVFTPPDFERTKPVLQYLAAHKQPQDEVYVYYWAHYALRFYGPGYGLQPEYNTGIPSREDWLNYVADIEPFRGKPRVWFVFGHTYPGAGENDQRFTLTYLNTLGTRLDEYKSREAAVYLYDLTRPPEKIVAGPGSLKP